MAQAPDFTHSKKPDRSEIAQFNKSATMGFLEWFDATMARDKRRFPKGCGFAWFLLEQMLQAYLEKYPKVWLQGGPRKPPAEREPVQSRLVLALMDDQTRQQRLHRVPEDLWRRVLSYRSERQPDKPAFEVIEHLLTKGLDAS